MRTLLRVMVLALLVGAACATKYTPPVAFKYFLIEATETTQLDIVCDGKVVYTVEIEAGVPVEIGGPEGACTFKTDKPVELLIVPVFNDADDE